MESDFLLSHTRLQKEFDEVGQKVSQAAVRDPQERLYERDPWKERKL